MMNTAENFLEKGRQDGGKSGFELGVSIGRLQMEERKNQQFVKNLLAMGRFTDAEIASFVNVCEGYVAMVREEN